MEKEILTHPYNITEINDDALANPLVQALLALREESYTKARECIEKGLDLIRDKQGKVPIKEAIKVFTDGVNAVEDPVKEKDTLHQLLLCRAEANAKLENNRSSIEDLDRILKADNTRGDAFKLKFKVLLKMGKYEEIIETYPKYKDVID